MPFKKIVSTLNTPPLLHLYKNYLHHTMHPYKPNNFRANICSIDSTLSEIFHHSRSNVTPCMCIPRAQVTAQGCRLCTGVSSRSTLPQEGELNRRESDNIHQRQSITAPCFKEGAQVIPRGPQNCDREHRASSASSTSVHTYTCATLVQTGSRIRGASVAEP